MCLGTLGTLLTMSMVLFPDCKWLMYVLPNRILVLSPALQEADLHYYTTSKHIPIILVIQFMYKVNFGVKNTD
jgi:hypothetical protein